MNLKTIITLGLIGLTAMAPARAFSAYSCDKADKGHMEEYTNDPAEVAKILSTTIGYSEGFAKGRELAEDPVAYNNQCHVVFRVGKSTGELELVIRGCALKMSRPAKVCQSEGVVRVVINNSSGSTGRLNIAEESATLIFTNATKNHLRITSPYDDRINFTFKAAPASKTEATR